MDSPVFRFMRALLDCDKPVVAAVTGAAIGIGTTMLLYCDFVYVSGEARRGVPFVGLGLVPGLHDYSVAASQKKYSRKSKALSDSIEKAIRDEFKDEVIRRRMPLPLLNSVAAPAVFLEYPSPKTARYDQQAKTKLINALINGVMAYGH